MLKIEAMDSDLINICSTSTSSSTESSRAFYFFQQQQITQSISSTSASSASSSSSSSIPLTHSLPSHPSLTYIPHTTHTIPLVSLLVALPSSWSFTHSSINSLTHSLIHSFLRGEECIPVEWSEVKCSGVYCHSYHNQSLASSQQKEETRWIEKE